MTAIPAFDPSVYETPALAEANRVHYDAYIIFKPVEDGYRAGTVSTHDFMDARSTYHIARDESDRLEALAIDAMREAPEENGDADAQTEFSL